MKRINCTLFMLLAVFVLLVGCERYKGNANEVTKTEATKTDAPIAALETNTQESQTIHLTENQVKDILNQLIPKAVNIYAIFNGKGFFKFDTKETIPDEKEYCLVTGVNGNPIIEAKNVKSTADLKKVVEGVFTKDMAQKLFYRTYLETKDRGLPLYKDYEGKLYVNTGNGGHGWAEKFLIDTAKLKVQKDNVAEIELDDKTLDLPAEKLTITIEYVNEKWLLASPLIL